jgi:hypothetical protein
MPSASRMLSTPPEVLLLDAKGTVMAWVQRADVPARQAACWPRHHSLRLPRRSTTGVSGELPAPGHHRGNLGGGPVPPRRKAGLHVMVGLPREALAARSEKRLAPGACRAGRGGAAAVLPEYGRWPSGACGARLRASPAWSMSSAKVPWRAAYAQPHPRGELGGLMAVLNRDRRIPAAATCRHPGISDASLRQAHQRARSPSARTTSSGSPAWPTSTTLTGLPNRVMFHERLPLAIARARRSGRPFALMFMDLDRFKHVNDNLGHRHRRPVAGRGGTCHRRLPARYRHHRAGSDRPWASKACSGWGATSSRSSPRSSVAQSRPT